MPMDWSNESTVHDALLILTNDTGVTFSATESRRSFLQQFVQYMNLRPGGQTQFLSIIFCERFDEATVPNPAEFRRHEMGEVSVWSRPGSNVIVLEVPAVEQRRESLYAMWYSIYTIYPYLLRNHHLPLHAALVERDGIGVLLSAPGGTGKSTAARRMPKPWRVLSDDESWLIKHPDNSLRAHPLPTWSDMLLRGRDGQWETHSAVPPGAIFFLEQSDEDRIKKLDHAEAAALLNQESEQMFRRAWQNLPPPDLDKVRKRILDVCVERARILPCYRLGITLHGKFWTLIEDVMAEQGHVFQTLPEER